MGASVTVTVENVGESPLTISGLTGADHFRVDQAGLASTLGAGESTGFSVALEPATGGILQGVITLTSDDPDEGEFTIEVQGHTTPNTFRQIVSSSAPTARFNSELAALSDGRVVMFGGRDNSGVYLGDTWIFDSSTGEWSELSISSAPSARDAHQLVALDGDIVLLYGGKDNLDEMEDTWTLDVAAGSWTQLTTTSPGARFRHHMVSLGEAALMVAGRPTTSASTEVNDTWIFDTVSNSWRDRSPVTSPGATSAAAMAFDGDDTVILYGGFVGGPLDETWRYSISANAWTESTSLTSPGERAALSGAMLSAGMVVFSGKLNSCCVDPSGGTFLYDVGEDSWSDLEPAAEPSPRYSYAMVAIPGANKAIIFGGQTLNAGPGSALNETWEYVGPLPD